MAEVLTIPSVRETLSRDIADFLAEARVAGRSEWTIRYYQTHLSKLRDYLLSEDIRHVTDITPRTIRSYLAALTERGHNPGGVHGHYRTAKAWLGYLVREEVIDANPCMKVRAPKAPTEVLEPVPLKTVTKLLSVCGPDLNGLRDRAILLTLLDSGLRARELTALNVGDFIIESGAVRVQHGKGAKGRITFVGAKARRALVKYLRKRRDSVDEEPLFLVRDGDRRLDYQGLRGMLIRRAKQAGVSPHPTAHSFRRAFAIGLLRNGADLASISRMMGHGSLPILMRYLRQESSDLERVHRKASPADRLLR